MAESRHILITRPIDPDLEDMFLRMGHRTETVPFIATMPAKDEDTQHRLRQIMLHPHTVIFTSANAVRAVSECTQGAITGWEVYAIGHATLEQVRSSMPAHAVKGTAPDAARLAERIIADTPTSPAIFFCGDQRREELPGLLQQAGIPLEELVVYHTIETPVHLGPVHDDLLFFSPSAVKSYFSVNRPKADAVFFAIGDTTAAAIREHTGNELMVSPKPSATELAYTVIRYHAEH